MAAVLRPLGRLRGEVKRLLVMFKKVVQSAGDPNVTARSRVQLRSTRSRCSHWTTTSPMTKRPSAGSSVGSLMAASPTMVPLVDVLSLSWARGGLKGDDRDAGVGARNVQRA